MGKYKKRIIVNHFPKRYVTEEAPRPLEYFLTQRLAPPPLEGGGCRGEWWTESTKLNTIPLAPSQHLRNPNLLQKHQFRMAHTLWFGLAFTRRMPRNARRCPESQSMRRNPRLPSKEWHSRRQKWQPQPRFAPHHPADITKRVRREGERRGHAELVSKHECEIVSGLGAIKAEQTLAEEALRQKRVRRVRRRRGRIPRAKGHVCMCRQEGGCLPPPFSNRKKTACTHTLSIRRNVPPFSRAPAPQASYGEARTHADTSIPKPPPPRPRARTSTGHYRVCRQTQDRMRSYKAQGKKQATYHLQKLPLRASTDRSRSQSSQRQRPRPWAGTCARWPRLPRTGRVRPSGEVARRANAGRAARRASCLAANMVEDVDFPFQVSDERSEDPPCLE